VAGLAFKASSAAQQFEAVGERAVGPKLLLVTSLGVGSWKCEKPRCGASSARANEDNESTGG
jgi:hypothetical protein